MTSHPQLLAERVSSCLAVSCSMKAYTPTFSALQHSLQRRFSLSTRVCLTAEHYLSRKHSSITDTVSQKYLATMATDTSKYKLNHSMIRVKDPQASMKFYELFGMKLINKISNPDAKFDLYFLAYDGPGSVSEGNHWTDREGVVELTHNYGTENDANFKVANGNSDPGRGFGHLCVSTDNIQAAVRMQQSVTLRPPGSMC